MLRITADELENDLDKYLDLAITERIIIETKDGLLELVYQKDSELK